MIITLKGAVRQSHAVTLADLLTEQGFGTKVATALNGSFVPAHLRPTTPLHDGDLIEVLAARQGG